MAKKSNSYFNDFIQMIKLSCEAAECLRSSLKEFKPEQLAQHRKTMHQIEHNEDNLKHEIMQRLVKEFLPPIDREDIILLANELDNITDNIEEVLIYMYMYNVQEVRPQALILADVILRCCQTLEKALGEFANFRKSNNLMNDIVEINTIEEEGDKIYIEAVRELYLQEKDPVLILTWSKLFDIMEECCDACEHTANVMESIIMKNS